MAEENRIEAETTGKEVPEENRRSFVKAAAKVAMAAPAVTLLLNAATKPTSAAPVYVGGEGPRIVSDLRLKRDVNPVDVLPNGMQLYTFRYWNDERTFVGVMAQDLMADQRFRHAVSADRSGYYVVDLAALGLDVSGSWTELFEAGSGALRAAKQVIN